VGETPAFHRHPRPRAGSRYDGPMNADELKRLLNLEPHPCEGGWFVQTWRADETIPKIVLPERYPGERAAGTAIYYLLEPHTFSEMHRLASDEVFHFYLGDPVEMLQLWPDGSTRTVMLGHDIAAGMHVQHLVPKGVWQGSRLLPGGNFGLLGCTVSPGFDCSDYESGNREELVRQYPQAEEKIRLLTHAK
jgi:uncharacterized protein